MHLEIKVALNFIISYLYNKLPRRRADLFGEELERLLKKKYEGHWYPEKPLKGSGYRCIHIGETVDPVVELAAKRSGLAVEDVRANVPEELSVWIDPFEVSYQIGEKGSVKVLYLDDSEGCSAMELDKEIKSSFNPEAQVFVPIGSQDNSLSNSPSPSFGQSPSPTFIPRSAQPITFTTATFAASSLFFDGVASESQASSIPPASQFNTGTGGTFDMAQVFGGSTNNLFLEKSPFVEGLSYNLNAMQYPSQSFQPVVLAN
ncbi:PREDICTED: protein Tob2 [Nestor notabilis]|uniref:protein Tob2 n=1 Tax=Nestor notabilis TaxID=176057 RepID=UPI00052392B4|nr:PREDICTED: protein Tob2 [Nestor notabilis]